MLAQLEILRPSICDLPEGAEFKYTDARLNGLMLAAKGIVNSEELTTLACCPACWPRISKGLMPRLALVNYLFLGPVPPELQGLTYIEEMAIALQVSTKCLSKIKAGPTGQRKATNNLVILPVDTSNVATQLPRSLSQLRDHVAIMFVTEGEKLNMVKQKQRALYVRRSKIVKALDWLIANNPLYAHIQRAPPQVFNEFPDDANPNADLIPFHIEEKAADDDNLAEGSGVMDNVDNLGGSADDDFDCPTYSSGMLDTDATAISTKEKKIRMIASLCKGDKMLEITESPTPLSEWNNPSLFPGMFPTLFPYGCGGFDDPARNGPTALTMETQVKHFLSLYDRRFQLHRSFPFVAWNILQRRKSCLWSKLVVDRRSYDRLRKKMKSLDPPALENLISRLRDGGSFKPTSPEEVAIFDVMREVHSVAAHLDGTAQAKHKCREEIHAIVAKRGTPSWYVTINPADVLNPIMAFMALDSPGFTLEDLMNDQLPTSTQRSIMVASDPASAARFFDTVISAFINGLLHYDTKTSKSKGAGILGNISDYYGMVEAQGRGSLHCHFLIWVDGALSPQDLRDAMQKDETYKQRVLGHLESIISTEMPGFNDPAGIPSDLQPNRRTRSNPNQGSSPARKISSAEERCFPSTQVAMEADLPRLIVDSGLVHEHTSTCWKYCKPGEERVCRFNLPAPIISESFVDEEGSIQLRRLHGEINNYNAATLYCMRNNMDIKHIGSGNAAKAMIFYVTDYITKDPLQVYTIFAALQVGMAKNQVDPNPEVHNDPKVQARRLFQRTVNHVIAKMELSAQQVMSYLLGIPDHFTPRKFRTLCWPAFDQKIPKVPVNAVEDDEEHEDGHDNPEIPLDGPMPNEVVLDTLNGDANLLPGDQYQDWVHRGGELENITLWEFVQWWEKIPAPGNKGKQVGSRPRAGRPLLERVAFMPDHPQYETHCMKKRSRNHDFTVVLRGPRPPRSDREDFRSREVYSRMMLILFSSWRNPDEIKVEDTWQGTFSVTTFDNESLAVMKNFQVLHECKDARDKHFNDRLRSKKAKAKGAGSNGLALDQINAIFEHFLGELVTEEEATEGALVEDLLQRALNQDTASSESSDVTTLLNNLRQVGRLSAQATLNMSSATPVNNTHLEPLEEMYTITTREHDKFGKSLLSLLKSRRDELLTEEQNTLRRSEAQAEIPNPELAQGLSYQSTIQRQFAAAALHQRQLQHETLRLRANGFQPPTRSLITDYHQEDLKRIALDVCTKWKLNREQSRAFHLFAAHHRSANVGDDGIPKAPLVMYISGPAGTGKTQILQAARDYLGRLEQGYMMKAGAITGVAARAIGGSTLHTLLQLHKSEDQLKKEKRKGTSFEDGWDDCHYLFIDEVSMVGARTLAQISKRLALAKANPDSDHSFGGLSVIFAGDFCQLPPVMEVKLYDFDEDRPTRGIRPQNTRGQELQMGISIWRNVATVVELTENYRQKSDPLYADILSRVRTGTVCDADIAVLKQCVIGNSTFPPEKVLSLREGSFRSAKIVVGPNAIRDKLNDACVQQFILDSESKASITLHSVDKCHGTRILDLQESETADSTWKYVQEKAWNHPIKAAHDFAGRLTLCDGMPVTIGHNLATECGVVNGADGIVHSIVYREHRGYPEAVYVNVKIPGSAVNFTGPNDDVVPIPTMDSREKIHLFIGAATKPILVARTQLPMLPSFAMTSYRSQGATMKEVKVDLQSCANIQDAYVMLSRVKTLAGLVILRVFDARKLKNHINEKLRKELLRITALAERTQVHYDRTTALELALK